jgi:hypothetical protein
MMTVVSVSIDTDNNRNQSQLPTRQEDVHESCPMPSLSSEESGPVRLRWLTTGSMNRDQV